MALQQAPLKTTVAFHAGKGRTEEIVQNTGPVGLISQADWQQYVNRTRHLPVMIVFHCDGSTLDEEQTERALQVAHRCSSILLRGGPAMIGWLLSHAEAFACLVSLRIISEEVDDAEADMHGPPLLRLHTLQALLSFELTSRPTLWWLVLEGVNLRTLRLGNGVYGYEFDEFLRFLEGMPRLENLYLAGQEYGFSGPPHSYAPETGTCSLPALIRLEVGGLGYEGYQNLFLQAIRAPQVKDLRVTDLARVPFDGRVLAHRFPKLKYLFIGNCDFKDWDGMSGNGNTDLSRWLITLMIGLDGWLTVETITKVTFYKALASEDGSEAPVPILQLSAVLPQTLEMLEVVGTLSTGQLISFWSRRREAQKSVPVIRCRNVTFVGRPLNDDEKAAWLEQGLIQIIANEDALLTETHRRFTPDTVDGGLEDIRQGLYL